MKYLAIDIGSSFLKYAVLDLQNRKIGLINRIPAPEPSMQKGTRYEIRPEEIWKMIQKAIRQISKEVKLSGIVFSTQMHGFLLENESGELITPYISWQDNRCLDGPVGKSCLDELKRMGLEPLMKNAGVGLTPNVSLCNLYTVIREKKLAGEKIHFYTLGSWLIRKMIGKNICHISNGAPTGLVDIVNGCWNDPLIKKLGCQSIIFPELETGIKRCGFYMEGANEIEIFPDFGDHQMCVLGSGLHAEEDVNINIGTAGLLSVIAREYSWKEGEVRPYFGGMYLNTERGLFGGRDLEVISCFLGEIVENICGKKAEPSDIWDAISFCKKKEDEMDNNLYIAPNFYENGRIDGISKDNLHFWTFIEAIYRAVAESYKDALGRVVQEGKKVRHIVYSGGAARKNPWLQERIAEKLKCDFRETETMDEAIMGLYRIALVCSGLCKCLAETEESET